MKLDEGIKVLDHGYVKYVGHMGTDETVVEAARMSTGKGFTDWDTVFECEKCGERSGPEAFLTTCDVRGAAHATKQIQGDKKLLEFLYKNAHHTPFEMCELALEVQAPIMVFREWHRHRTQSVSEFSARYAQMPNLHYLPELERFQKQSTTNKQGSAEAFDERDAQEYREYIKLDQEAVYDHYDMMVRDGLAKEVARLNTPVSRYSKMRVKTDLRNWLGFLNLRMRPNAQYEIRMYAEAVASIIKELWPRSYALFEEYDLNGVKLSATERKLAWSALHQMHEELGDMKLHGELLKRLA